MSEDKTVYELRRRTIEELNEIAIDLADGKVFCDKHLDSQDLDMIKMIFLPISFGVLSSWSDEMINDVGMIFEYLDKSIVPLEGDGAIPSFATMQLMHKDDMGEFMEIGKELVNGKQT